MEFNTIKTLKLINKEPLLKIVYENNSASWTFTKFKELETKNELPNEVTQKLKDIFNDLILVNDAFIEEYGKIEEKESTPRRYGKVRILKDIETQGGIPTDIQSSGLFLADVYAAVGNLQCKGVSDHYKGTKKLSKENHKQIRAASRTFLKQLKHITK